MLLNAAYCGYVTGMRSKDRSIKGLHEPLVSEELFDRVQQMRTWRARVVKPGRPSEEYLLRKLLYCERCDARMHGQKGSTPQVRRYMCSTRRYGGELRAADHQGRTAGGADRRVAARLPARRGAARRASSPRCARPPSDEGGDGARRKELGGQLERLRELYVMGDLTKDEYAMMRCQAIAEELERIGPPLDPQIERADAILRDFARFWEVEPKAAERRKLIASLFDRVWQDEGRIVAVKPREPFLRYFQARRRGRPATHGCQSREQGWGWSNPQQGHQTA